MKIVHVVPFLSKGGAERVAAELANHASLSGHQLTVIASSPVDPSILRNYLDSNVKVIYVNDSASKKIDRYFNILPWLWSHRLWLFEQDVIHCHLTYGAVFGLLVHMLRSILRKQYPVIVETYHAVGMDIPLFHRRFHAVMLSRHDAVAFMAEDAYWSKFLVRHPKLKTEIIPNGILSFDASVKQTEKNYYRSELGIPEECRFVVGTVGMLRPDRQPWLYLPIFAEIARIYGHEVHFLMAGGGPEYNRIQALVQKYGLSGQVHLPGLVLNPHLPLSIMDLYITLNVGAITGMAALEASFSNLPVIAIQLINGYKSGVNDWIWSSTDQREVAQKAIELLENGSDRQFLAQRQGVYVRAHHTTDVMAKSYYTLYQAVIQQVADKKP